MMGGASTAARSCVLVRLSKIGDYLADNLCVSMLSRWNAAVKMKSGLAEDPGSKLGISRPLLTTPNFPSRISCPPNSRHFAFMASSDSIDSMATLTIRQLDEKTKTRLRVRAAHHGRSMEEEAREILRSALTASSPAKGNLADAIHQRFAVFGGVEFEFPRRVAMRQAPEFAE